jgi:hypothetical protein
MTTVENTKKEVAPLAQKQPQTQINEPISSLSETPVIVNNPLRELRLSREIPATEMVAVVKTLYPGYDKHLQSKCERSNYYGIKICDDAMETLYKTYAPEKAKANKKSDKRKNPCRLACRVSVQDYSRVKTLMYKEGFSTVQDWLYSLIKKYLKEKEI